MCLFLLTCLLYSNKEQIVSFLLQAVWAGWGHASENPKLPELLHKNGIAFMGEEMDCSSDVCSLFELGRFRGIENPESKRDPWGMVCSEDGRFVLVWKKGKSFQNSL